MNVFVFYSRIHRSLSASVRVHRWQLMLGEPLSGENASRPRDRHAEPMARVGTGSSRPAASPTSRVRGILWLFTEFLTRRFPLNRRHQSGTGLFCSFRFRFASLCEVAGNDDVVLLYCQNCGTARTDRLRTRTRKDFTALYRVFLSSFF